MFGNFSDRGGKGPRRIDAAESHPDSMNVKSLSQRRLVTSMQTANKSRVLLTQEQAREIFLLKSNHEGSSTHSASIRLAHQYHVSSKAIRDIWKGRSWLQATFDLWESDDRPAKKPIGRPKGKKDSRPRCKSKSSVPSFTSKMMNNNFYDGFLHDNSRLQSGLQSEILSHASPKLPFPIDARLYPCQSNARQSQEFAPATTSLPSLSQLMAMHDKLSFQRHAPVRTLIDASSFSNQFQLLSSPFQPSQDLSGILAADAYPPSNHPPQNPLSCSAAKPWTQLLSPPHHLLAPALPYSLPP